MAGKRAVHRRRRPKRDLNHIIREVLRDVIGEYGWTQDEAAEKLGLSLSTIQGVLARDPKHQRNLSVRALSLVCERLGENPIEFMQRHPLYSPKTKGRVVDPDHALYLRFRKLGTAEDLNRWHRVLATFRDAHALAPVLTALEGAAEALQRVQRRVVRGPRKRAGR
ncbi:MAG: helix-turn-helix transcriptional regulator [Myxococcota bacterium]